MVRLEEIKEVGKEDAQVALIHFFQMKPRKSVSEEWKKKESSKQKDYMKKFDYELIIVLALVAIFVLGICLDNMLLFIALIGQRKGNGEESGSSGVTGSR